MLQAPALSSIKTPWLKRSDSLIPAFLYLLYTVLVLSSLQNGFFWDSILLASRYGQWYFQTDFKTLFVPETIAGYPPLFGMLLALTWKIFGQNLAVSHLLMLPFALGIVRQVLVLCRKFLPPATAAFAALLALADPTLLAQCTQVAPDVLLVFLYLFSLNKILENRRVPLAISLLFLGLLSPRGTIAVALLFVTDCSIFFWFSEEKKSWQKFIRIAIPYLPAGVLVIAWQAAHYLHFGWVGYNPDSSWGSLARFAGLSGMLRNSALIGWRLLDFGRVFMWFGLAATLLYYYRKNLPLPKNASLLFTVVLIPFIGYSLVFLPYTNPIGHRYYLVVFLLLGLLTVYLLTFIPNRFFRRITYGFMLLGLISGHFWVYPDTVAKGWDASLAHLPYFGLRQQAIKYLDENKIPLPAVGSAYPNLSPLSITDLSNDSRAFKSKELETDEFVLYSNVFNDFSDEEIMALKTSWQPVKTWEKGKVTFVLYKKGNHKR